MSMRCYSPKIPPVVALPPCCTCSPPVVVCVNLSVVVPVDEPLSVRTSCGHDVNRCTGSLGPAELVRIVAVCD